jgi:ribosomal protein S18 acetylase RimI-like enzyme
LLIRRATLDDAAGIAEVHLRARQAAYRDFFPNDYLMSLTIEYTTELWAQRLVEEGATSLVAVIDGRIVGQVRFGRAQIVDNPVGEVYQLHVHPDFWRRSIGAALLREALARLSAASFNEAVLNVYEANANARAFYEHEGWRFDGPSHDAERGGVLLKQLRYRRSTLLD